MGAPFRTPDAAADLADAFGHSDAFFTRGGNWCA